jgi:hypothetical protein
MIYKLRLIYALMAKKSIYPKTKFSILHLKLKESLLDYQSKKIMIAIVFNQSGR